MAHNLQVGERKILGVRIDDISEHQAIERISSWLSSSKEPKLVFTPGPEFLVTASKDGEFKKILNEGDLNIPDGMGLRLGGAKNRIPGVDLMVRLCGLAAENGYTVGLIGGVNGVSEKAANKLKDKFPKLKVKLALSDDKADKVMQYYFIDNSITIPSDNVDILFVGLGHPKQEKLLLTIVESKNSKGIKFKVGMGVGGSFDLISGAKKRSPKIMTALGIEWLWRGLQDPKHFARVWRATVEYLWLLIRN